MIIFEGIDGAGKSTLIKHCVEFIRPFMPLTSSPIAIQGSEGAARSVTEIHERIERYYTLTNTLFDRHPCVSQPIYNISRFNPIPIDDRAIKKFYEQKPFFIYCDPLKRNPLEDHTPNPKDTRQHLANIRASYFRLLIEYRDWAISHAHVVYRIGDSMDMVASLVIAAIQGGH